MTPEEDVQTPFTPLCPTAYIKSDKPADLEQRENTEDWREQTLDFGITTSKHFQWLPSEFLVDKNGRVKIASYINNLHPHRHKDLYRTLEKIFGKFVPMFEKVLKRQQTPRRIRVDFEEFLYKNSHRDPEGERIRVPFVPEIPEFRPREDTSSYLSLKGRRLQVIVKLANIELTPENPAYQGGSWHVEGMLNERIVATGIYYYSSQNITNSRLGFQR